MRAAIIPLCVLTLLAIFVLPGTTVNTTDRQPARVRSVVELPFSPRFSLGITPRRPSPQEPRLVVKHADTTERVAEPPASQAAGPIEAPPAPTPSPKNPQEPATPPTSADLIASNAGCESQPMSEPERTLLASLNRERLDRGIAVLDTHPCGEQVAMLRARDLAEHGYFAHVGPSGESAVSLLRSLEVVYSNVGENLARNNYPAGRSVQVAFLALMNSDLHRAAILSTSFSHVGVASTEDSAGMKYYVVIFLSA